MIKVFNQKNIQLANKSNQKINAKKLDFLCILLYFCSNVVNG